MLFYLAPSVADSLISNDVEVFEFICRLIDARRRGLLLIYASDSTYSKIANFFHSVGRQVEYRVILSISKRAREVRSLLRDLTKFVFISTWVKKNRKFGNKIILSSPKIINKNNFLYFPVILGENLDDCNLYFDGIAKNFIKDIPASMMKLKINARKQLGGGNTTHTQYSHYKSEELDFCFCIVDSDRRCPAEGFGETAKLLIDCDKNGIKANCEYLVIDMYSAENLLDLNELRRQFIIDKSDAEIGKFEIISKLRTRASWQYLPLKKGVKGSDIKSVKAHSNYWKRELIESGVDISCCTEEVCQCIIVPAISSKTLSNSISAENSGWYGNTNNELNSDIFLIYKEISKNIRSWFCVGSEIRS